MEYGLTMPGRGPLSTPETLVKIAKHAEDLLPTEIPDNVHAGLAASALARVLIRGSESAGLAPSKCAPSRIHVSIRAMTSAGRGSRLGGHLPPQLAPSVPLPRSS